MVYDDDTSTFRELLIKDGAYTIHERNLQYLAIECYKAYKDVGPRILKDIFKVANYEGPQLRNKGEMIISISSVHFGENSLKYLGAKIWSLIPLSMKQINTLEQFKILIKHWVPKPCPCRLCKTYINAVGFVNII